MRISKVLAVLCVALIAATDNFAQTPSATLTLRQCIEAALTNNLDVKQRDLDMQRDWVTLRGAKGNMLPSLNGSVDHTLRQGRSIDPYTNSYTNQSNTSASYNLSSDVTLFNGFRLFNNLRAAQFLYEAGKMELQQSKDILTLNVILAYLQVLTNLDVLIQSERLAEVTTKQVERLEIMNKEGAIKPSDLYDMKGQQAGNKMAVINARNDLNASRLNLAQLMNMPYDETLTVERLTADQFDMSYTASADSIYQVALQQLAQIKVIELVKKSAEKSVQSARGNLYPSIGMGGGINTNFSGAARDSANKKIKYYDQLSNNYSTNVGIGINIPILNGFSARNQLSMAKIALKNAEYVAQTTQIQLRQNIERDHLNMIATLNRYQALVEQVGSYTENFRAAEVRFNAGASTSVDYLIAKNNLDQATLNLIIARYGYVLRTKILDYYQGKLGW